MPLIISQGLGPEGSPPPIVPFKIIGVTNNQTTIDILLNQTAEFVGTVTDPANWTVTVVSGPAVAVVVSAVAQSVPGVITITVSGQTIGATYRVHAPPNLTSTRTLPLVVTSWNFTGDYMRTTGTAAATTDCRAVTVTFIRALGPSALVTSNWTEFWHAIGILGVTADASSTIFTFATERQTPGYGYWLIPDSVFDINLNEIYSFVPPPPPP